jgi:hypothetical protein
METIVQGQIARAVTFTTFADLTDAPVLRIDRSQGVTFDGELTGEQYDAVWWRMTSRDDAHEQARRSLAAAVAALEPPAPVLADQVAALQAAVRQAACLLLGTD